ncbi:MAG TPA: OmpW family outer membrane protein [Candidatus Megaira endosymbiont of Hartmannula sinica]|nr:OmpW family outer membrane protein [Candidatus Megaera endosymbiont of Hartmannula sinica]
MFKTRSYHGYNLQVGVDFNLNDYSFIGLEAKKSFAKHRIIYKKEFFNQSENISSDMKFNPLSISITFGIKV